ncbi:MAG: hypothetical protein U5K29_01810 [Acidimicrobiales bacterium]|nr:hypothetical protein [Acidimicrobiales bacterium]
MAASSECTPDLNLVVLHGHLSSEPRSRTLPSGDEVWTYEVTTRTGSGPAESVAVVPGRARPPRALSAGDEVLVVGRVRRRFFRAGGGTASRTEVVADRITSGARQSSVTAGLDRSYRVIADHVAALGAV